MIMYYPWSQEVLQECLSAHSKGKISTLDLELTAKCSKVNCIYCDSRPDVGVRMQNELNAREREKIILNAKKLGVKWIYSCGLGEPFEDPSITRIIEVASKNNIRISLFTNGILIDEGKAKWLNDNGVCLILKMDSLIEDDFDKLLGKKGAANKIYASMNFLLKAGYNKINNGNTNLALSIVPTSVNYNYILDIVKYCLDNNIYPSIGELEKAGRAAERSTYNELSVSQEETLDLKQRLEDLLWKGYSRPICPTIITGIHIDNIGQCTVDLETGLNCKWFMLTEPMVHKIGDIRSNDIQTLFSSVSEYRRECFSKKNNGVENAEKVCFPFGGCGGSPRNIIKLARKYLI